MSRAEVLTVDGGYVIRDQDDTKVFYVGRDGYWTRVMQAATPFKQKSLAQAMADDLNKRAGGWE